MDYSIKGYLNRLSIEELEKIFSFCIERNEEYEYLIEEINQILNEKKNCYFCEIN